MSLHNTLKNTWYMRLKQQRDERDVAPSMFALSIPSIQKTADTIASKKHHPELAPSDLKTASMTEGDYIKANVGTHKNSYTPKERSKILASFKVDMGTDNASAGSAEPEGATTETPDEFLRPHSEALTATNDALQLLAENDVGKKAIYEPMNELYTQIELGITLEATRKGATILVNGENLEKVNDLDLLKEIKKRMTALSKAPQLTKNVKANTATGAMARKGLALARVKSDLGKITNQIKRIEAREEA